MTTYKSPSRVTRCLCLPSCLLAAAFAVCGVLVAADSPAVQASSKQVPAAGSTVFREKGCAHCHGADFTGTDRGPDLQSVGKKWHKNRIEQQIREGGNGMPAFGDVLQPDEIQSLVDFLSTKRKAVRKTPTPDHKSAKPAADPGSDDSGD